MFLLNNDYDVIWLEFGKIIDWRMKNSVNLCDACKIRDNQSQVMDPFSGRAGRVWISANYHVN